jgi:transposase
MTREVLFDASRDELIELALSACAEKEAAATLAEQEKARRIEAERQLLWFKKQIFGPKSEKRHGDFVDVTQLSLGEAVEGERRPVEKTLTVKAHTRELSQPADSRDEPALRFDDSVPRTRRVILPPEVEGLGESEYEIIDERVTQRLVQTPAIYLVEEIVRPVVKLKGTTRIVTAPAEPGVLERSLADVSLLAGLLVDKFRFHLPLYRQHQRMLAAGIHLARSTLTSWVHGSIDLLAPIHEAQLASILTSSVLAMDETPIKAGRKSKGKMKQGYFWPVYGDQDEVAFPFAASRAHRHAVEILGEYCGTLLSDDYGAYDAFAAKREAVTRAACWAHVRRKFVDAEDVEPERVEHVLGLIRGIYRIEKEVREQRLEGEAKRDVRVEQSRPIVAELFAWLKQELAAHALLPTSPFTEAARHALKRKTQLEVFVTDPAVPVDTNHLERALRPIPMGRKAWLFCWTEVGAEKVGIIQSLISTCVLHGIDPYTYLVDVLQRVAIHPQSEVADLTPRLWKARFADRAIPSPALANRS